MNNYNRYPKRMLRARAQGALCDQVAADLLFGLATVEVVREEQELADDGVVATEPAPPAPPPQAAPERDFRTEVAILKDRIAATCNGGTPEARKAVRGDVDRLLKEAPADVADDLKRFYNMIAHPQSNGGASSNGNGADLFGQQPAAR